jgi:DNA polymerase elongation subunit (family B)
MYSNVFMDHRKSEIQYWEYENGVKIHKTVPAPLFFYYKDKTLKNPEYHTIFGDPARKIECARWNDYKQKRDRLKATGMELYESDVPLETKFIIENYMGQELKVPKFDIWYLDIEVHSDRGFPKAEEANYPITVITVWSTKDDKYYIFAERDFDTKFLDDRGEKFSKFIFASEEKLLKAFIRFVYDRHPDFLSGWNSNFFDIPYIVNRANKIIDEDAACGLSPIGVVREIEQTLKNGKVKKTFFIGGISTIDLLEVFKTYTFAAKPSWKLDSIAEEILGEQKLHFDCTLAELYKDRWQDYMEYNVHDVRLLKKLEAKKGFLNILVSFCYGCHVPFESYQKTVRVLDGAFLSKLAEEKIVLPDVNRELEASKFPGGYVKDPIKGLHEWTVSFDATSLYPSIMIGWNISPETKIGKVESAYVSDLRKLIGGKEVEDYDIKFSGLDMTLKELATLILENKFCLAGNGAVYKQDKVGIVPRFVDEWFKKRNNYKRLMLEAEKNGDKDAKVLYDSLQLNYKILINSVYGYLSTPYSRFYDLDNAMAVTLTGQSITKTVNDTMNGYFAQKFEESGLAKKYEAKNIDNVSIYCYTDSIYVDIGKILDALHIKNRDATTPELMTPVIETINTEVVPFVTSIINKAMTTLTEKKYNCVTNKISFKVEKVARRSIFLEKKKYVMWVVYDGEAKMLVDKIKATGIELVRSSTPPLAKKYMKEYIFELLKKMDREQFIERIKEVRTKFMAADVIDISFPSTANNLGRYYDKFLELGRFKSTPIHIRGSIIYNDHLIEHPEFEQMYEPIYEGDKIKLVHTKKGKDWSTDVISYKEKWVGGFNIDEYVDREKQFEKAFLNPLEKFFDLLNWEKPSLNQSEIETYFKW